MMYSGRRDKTGLCIVHVINIAGDSYLLNPRLDLFNHSPTGFEWSYGGSGPAQLALAILADCLGSAHETMALQFHQQFKREFIAPLLRDEPWTINGRDVMKFVVDQLKYKQES